MFPWHSMRDKAKTVHSYQFIHLLLMHRKPTKTPVDSSLFWQDQDCCSPRKKGKLNILHKVKKADTTHDYTSRVTAGRMSCQMHIDTCQDKIFVDWAVDCWAAITLNTFLNLKPLWDGKNMLEL